MKLAKFLIYHENAFIISIVTEDVEQSIHHFVLSIDLASEALQIDERAQAYLDNFESFPEDIQEKLTARVRFLFETNELFVESGIKVNDLSFRLLPEFIEMGVLAQAAFHVDLVSPLGEVKVTMNGLELNVPIIEKAISKSRKLCGGDNSNLTIQEIYQEAANRLSGKETF